jgi:hypothetical protein
LRVKTKKNITSTQPNVSSSHSLTHIRI